MKTFVLSSLAAFTLVLCLSANASADPRGYGYGRVAVVHPGVNQVGYGQRVYAPARVSLYPYSPLYSTPYVSTYYPNYYNVLPSTYVYPSVVTPLYSNFYSPSCYGCGY